MALGTKAKRIRSCCISSCGNLDSDESLLVTSPFLKAQTSFETDEPYSNQESIMTKLDSYVEIE